MWYFYITYSLFLCVLQCTLYIVYCRSKDEENGPNASINSKRSRDSETKENIHNGDNVGFNCCVSRSGQLR